MKPSLNADTPMPVPASCVRIEIRGLGNCVSFKNTKSIFRTKDGRRFIATNPRYKKLMELITQSIGSQLYSLSQTTAGETLTGARLLSWIACHIPLDDSWQWIPEIKLSAKAVPKGEEATTITIERIQ